MFWYGPLRFAQFADPIVSRDTGVVVIACACVEWAPAVAPLAALAVALLLRCLSPAFHIL